MQKLFIRARREGIARSLFENPCQPQKDLAASFGIEARQLRIYIEETGGISSFLKTYLIDVDESSIDEAARAFIEYSKRYCGTRYRYMTPLWLKDAKLKSSGASDLHQNPLSAHECQFALPHRPPEYCRKPVIGLYCEEHSLIAALEEDVRFFVPIEKQLPHSR